MDSETIRYIREEVRRQMNIILPGVSADSAKDSESIQNMFPGMPKITKRPVMHPYGMVSRAPNGTASVIGRMGDHIGNRLVLGHRDNNRPDIESGEVMLYNESGEKIYLKNGSILIGSETSTEPLVLGDVLKTFLTAFLDSFLNATQIGQSAVGAVFLDPTVRQQLVTQKQTYLTDASTNIVSQLSFTERGE